MSRDRDLHTLLRAAREERPSDLRKRRVRNRVLMAVGTGSAAGVATASAASAHSQLTVGAAAKAAATWSTAGKGLIPWMVSHAALKVSVATVSLGIGVAVSLLSPPSPSLPAGSAAPGRTVQASAPSERAPRATARVTAPLASRASASAAARLEMPRQSDLTMSPIRPSQPEESSLLPAMPAQPARGSPPVDTSHDRAPQRCVPRAVVLEVREPAPDREAPLPAQAREAAPISSAPLPTLFAEAQLLSSALRTLSTDGPARALELLTVHARRFPHGALAPERAAARIRALCALGDHAQAHAEQRAFMQHYPGSPLTKALTECAP